MTSIYNSASSIPLKDVFRLHLLLIIKSRLMRQCPFQGIASSLSLNLSISTPRRWVQFFLFHLWQKLLNLICFYIHISCFNAIPSKNNAQNIHPNLYIALGLHKQVLHQRTLPPLIQHNSPQSSTLPSLSSLRDVS